MKNELMRPNFSNEVSRLIKKRIEVYPELSKMYCGVEDVKKYDALPIGCDFEVVFFLKTNGEIFSLDIDDELSPVTELWQQLVCLRLASNDFPELITVLPARPENAILCVICYGRGFLDKRSFYGELENFPCWSCGTMGWYDGHPLFNYN